MTQNKPGLLTSTFLSALLLGCSHTPPPKPLVEPQLYAVGEYGALRVITNNPDIWKDATSHLQRNKDAPQSPQQKLEDVEREINKAALQRGFQLCNRKDITQRSARQMARESYIAAAAMPKEKFSGFFVVASDPQMESVAESLLYGTRCPN